MNKFLLELQELIMSKLHPAFIKGFVSIAIGVLTFWSVVFGSDEASKYISPLALWVIKITVGSVAMFFNQFRDALSSFYTDKSNSKPTITSNEPLPPKI